MFGQCPDDVGNRVADSFSAVAGQRGTVLDARRDAVAVHARQVQQHGAPGGPLDERADRGAVEPDDEITFRKTVGGSGGSGVGAHRKSRFLLIEWSRSTLNRSLRSTHGSVAAADNARCLTHATSAAFATSCSPNATADPAPTVSDEVSNTP